MMKKIEERAAAWAPALLLLTGIAAGVIISSGVFAASEPPAPIDPVGACCFASCPDQFNPEGSGTFARCVGECCLLLNENVCEKQLGGRWAGEFTDCVAGDCQTVDVELLSFGVE